MFSVKNLINLHSIEDFDFIANNKGKLIADGAIIALVSLVAGLILSGVIPLPAGVGALIDKIIYGVLGVTGIFAICDLSFVIKHLTKSPFTKEFADKEYYDSSGNRYFLSEMVFGFKIAKGFDYKLDDEYIIASKPSFKEESSEYKVHLMPKSEHMQLVVSRLMEKIARDGELKQKVVHYKVILGEKDLYDEVVVPDKHGKSSPRIAICAESKEALQIILDKIIEIFPDFESLGDNIEPRNNIRINNLIFYGKCL
jgi:hypothetical protein